MDLKLCFMSMHTDVTAGEGVDVCSSCTLAMITPDCDLGPHVLGFDAVTQKRLGGTTGRAFLILVTMHLHTC